MASNIQLLEIAKNYNLDLYPPICKDELETMTPLNKAYIINLQDSDADWVALYIRENQACYCDSFGAPSPTVIDKFIKRRRGCKMVYNKFIIQDLKSENCGLFALACNLYLANKKTNDLFYNFNNFINGFDDNTQLNDKILESFYKQFPANTPVLLKQLLSQKKI